MGTNLMHSLAVKSLGRVVAVAAFTFAAAPAFAQTGPFAPLAGTWSGEGTITTSNGGSERIRCRARYTVGEGGRAFQQALTCASDSYKFEISSNVETDGTKVTGTWSEATRGVSGSLSGRISGPNISATVEGTGFAAGVAVNTRGRSQSVNIKPGSTDVTDVTVNLHK
jgi:hypothetical protein